MTGKALEDLEASGAFSCKLKYDECKKIWAAVLLQAMRDASIQLVEEGGTSGTASSFEGNGIGAREGHIRRARNWILNGDESFINVCEVIEVDFKEVQYKLMRIIEGKEILDDVPFHNR